MAVISNSVWERQFNRDPNVLGRRVQSESQSYTVVGVAPPDFTGALAPIRTDLWKPLRVWARQQPAVEDRRRSYVMLFGRLGTGLAAAQATAELNAIDAQVRSEHAPSPTATSPLAVEPVRGVAQSATRSSSRLVVTLLMTVVGLVLAIACVNVGNLLLVRGAARQRELAVRRALGAGRARLFRQLLTETLVLALIGGVCGLLVAQWTTHQVAALLPSLPAAMSYQLDLPLNVRVLGFATALALVTTLVCGVLPAWRISRDQCAPSLRGDSPSALHLRGRTSALIGEIALSLTLLLVAGTFLRGLWTLEATDPGFAIQNRVYAYTYLPGDQYTPARGRQFYAGLLDRVRTLPDVQRAALTYLLPLSTPSSECVSRRDGDKVQVTTATIDSGFLSTMGIELLAGREFGVTDRPDTPAVMIVNETLARQLWPNESAVGQRLLVGCENASMAEVIGVAHDSKIRSLGELPHPHLYQPFAQHYSGLATIVVESRNTASGTVNMVRRTLHDVGEGVRVYAVQSLADHVERSYWGVRWEARLLGVFAFVALGLAAVGLYGIIAYRVTLRTRDIGVRLALGARPQDMVVEVVRQGLIVTLVGIVIGEGLSTAVSRLLAKVQTNVEPADLRTYVTIAVVWVVVTLVTCYIPARRAARVDPIAALRAE